MRRCPRVFAFVSAPLTLYTSCPDSLCSNELCGLDSCGNGTYTTEGITKLSEALKGSAVTSLKCAASSSCSLLCQRPLTLLSTCFLTRACRLGGNQLGPEGGAALAEGLKGNSTLQVLE